MIRIVLLPSNAEDPAPVLLVHPTGLVERGLLEPDFAEHRRPMRTLLVVPGADVLARWIELPARSEAQAASAAAYLLEDDIAAPREEVHLALGAVAADGWRLVAVVDRLRLQEWLDRAGALGLKPDAVTPDHLMLPEPEGDEAIGAPFGSTVALRARRLALSCEPDLVPMLLGDRPWRLIDDASLEAMLAATAAAPPVDLLQGAFSRRPAGSAGWRRVAALAALLLLTPALIPAVQAFRHDRAANRAEAQAEARLRTAFPQAPPSANPAALIRQRETALRSGGEFARSAAALFSAVERVEGVELDAFLYAPGQPMQAKVGYAAPPQMEALRAAARDAGLTLEGTTARNEGGRLVSDLTLRR